MNNLFLDANIILDFFRMADDDLDKMELLLEQVKENKINLYSNKQLKSEVFRNRDKVLKESLGAVKNHKWSFQGPVYARKYDAHREVSFHINEAKKCLAKLVKEIEEKISLRELEADKLVNELFDLSVEMVCTPEIVIKARARVELGEPPGKKGSMGDAIHWLTLLNELNLKDICIVTKDDDFSGMALQQTFSTYLYDEWLKNKGEDAKIRRYDRLSTYLKDYIPQIQLSKESEINELVGLLVNPNSYASEDRFHSLIVDTDSFSMPQEFDLVRALKGSENDKLNSDYRLLEQIIQKIMTDGEEDLGL